MSRNNIEALTGEADDGYYKEITRTDYGQKVLLDVNLAPAHTDLSGKLEVVNAYKVFEHKNIFSKGSTLWGEVLVGGGTVTYNSAESTVSLSVGTASGDRALRRSYRYLAYVPGHTQEIQMTAVLGNGQANTKALAYYGDDGNGLGVMMNGTTLSVFERTNTSGSAVDTIVPQSSFNQDPMDGNGPSGIALDPSKTQLFMFKFLWLGVGPIEYYCIINAIPYLMHRTQHANIYTLPYMATPSLPVSYEVINTAATAASYTLKEICSTVSSEGGYDLPGHEFSTSNQITGRTLNAGAYTPILAIRLKTSFNSKENRRTVKLLHAHGFNTGANVHYELRHVHLPSAITATWNDISTESAVEYSTDITAITGNPSHVVDNFYVPSGQADKGGVENANIEVLNKHARIVQNLDSTNSEVFVIFAREFAAAVAYASMTWIEYD